MLLIALEMTSVASTRDDDDSRIMIVLPQRLIAETSVGLNAVAVLNDSAR